MSSGEWILVNEIDCWVGCGNKGGLCEDVCNTNGYCCAKNFDDCPSEAWEALTKNYHHCVKMKTGN